MPQRTWLVTGVNRGLGRRLIETILERGDRVAGTARRPDELSDLQARHGERLWLAPLDLTDASAIRQTVDAAFARMGRIDVVVSNAGYSVVGAAEEATDDAISHIVDTNLIGSIQLARAVLPHLRAQGGGRILQVSSSAGQTAIPGVSLYVATKWGIEGFIEALAMEVASFGIETTLVEPGGIRTGFASNSVGSPEIAAYADTPVAAVKALVASGFPGAPGDPAKMAQAIVDSMDVTPAPKRLALGGDAYESVRAALKARLAQLESQREIAFSTDYA
jgi:NAD(P)-dependent dehydrogenase (short-subunit alcohol dehydrogenase family)